MVSPIGTTKPPSSPLIVSSEAVIAAIIATVIAAARVRRRSNRMRRLQQTNSKPTDRPASIAYHEIVLGVPVRVSLADGTYPIFLRPSIVVADRRSWPATDLRVDGSAASKIQKWLDGLLGGGGGGGLLR
ncbi:hypothetical protein QTP88_011871 [Uroleucon formosanum]